MSARQLHCAFPGFGAGIREEDAIHAGAFVETHREFCLALVIEEVGCVDERLALTGDGLFDHGVGVTESVDADAA